MRDFMNITRALADETRVRVLMALRGGELCVCQITELFGLAPSTISKHLSILYQAGLLESRKAERWVYYRLPDGEPSGPAGAALDWVARAVARDPRIVTDSRQLTKILKIDPADAMQTPMSKMKPTVLILCTGNSCRSHMAEGILRTSAAGDV